MDGYVIKKYVLPFDDHFDESRSIPPKEKQKPLVTYDGRRNGHNFKSLAQSLVTHSEINGVHKKGDHAILYCSSSIEGKSRSTREPSKALT
jgi:hypothetical protein